MDKGYTSQRLMELAVECDAGLAPEYFAEAMHHLDQLAGSRLNLVLRGTGRDAAWVRAHFVDWLREVEPIEDARRETPTESSTGVEQPKLR